MLAQLIISLIIIRGVQGGSNTSAPVAKYGEVCSNECGEGSPSNWCGQYRSGDKGQAMRCLQLTIYGKACALEGCVQSEKRSNYYFCKTNENALSGKGANIWWDYCSLQGLTKHGTACTDECAQRGEDYYWCHTQSSSSTTWDYCSPPGRAVPVEKTIYGGRCISECGKYKGASYYWCQRNIHSCDSKNCPARWDYCSPDEYHTRYNKKCKDRCGQGGESYYWCYKEEGGWDYCSPATQYEEYDYHNIKLTMSGLKCDGDCTQAGYSYYWCKVVGGSRINWWDYCSPHNNTLYGEQCHDRCSSRGAGYYWCNTGRGWDYCSPQYGPGRWWRYQAPFYERLWFHVVLIIVIIVSVSCYCCRAHF